MSTFVLIHGACHGPWCWTPLAPHLEGKDHRVVAPELPCDDPAAGLADYADRVLSSIPGGAGDVVVVGHSLGALTAAVVADRRPVDALVFLAGIVGQPGQALADLAETDSDRDGALEDGEIAVFDNGTFIFTPAGAARALYHDCPAEVAADATRQLRPQRSMWNERLPIDAWPDVATASIVCTEDRVVNRSWAERIARDRLGVEPILLASGHSPMLSAPEELAAVLDSLANRSG